MMWSVIAWRPPPRSRWLVFTVTPTRPEAEHVREQLERIGCEVRVERAWPSDQAGLERKGLGGA